MGELYFKIQVERKELSVPGITKGQQEEDGGLFTGEDLKAQRMERNLQQMSMLGGRFTPLKGYPFRSGRPLYRGWRGRPNYLGRQFGKELDRNTKVASEQAR